MKDHFYSKYNYYNKTLFAIMIVVEIYESIVYFGFEYKRKIMKLRRMKSHMGHVIGFGNKL